LTTRAQVWLFGICWNDARMLPFFFRHYDAWIDRYILYDDGSTDGTLELLAAHPRVEQRRFRRVVTDSFVWSATLFQNNIWKEARGQADWVVVTAIDEHLYHPDMPSYLARSRNEGTTAIPALGFNMISEVFPAPDEYLARTRRRGSPDWDMSKLSILDPVAIEETHYRPGRHSAAPTGRVVYPSCDEVLNLHYKYLGRQNVAERHKLLKTGLGPGDILKKLGEHYAWSREELDAHWQKLMATAIDYRDPTVGFATHEERWWRGPRRR
jgi:hypothetical protein